MPIVSVVMNMPKLLEDFQGAKNQILKNRHLRKAVTLLTYNLYCKFTPEVCSPRHPILPISPKVKNSSMSYNYFLFQFQPPSCWRPFCGVMVVSNVGSRRFWEMAGNTASIDNSE